MKTSIKRLSCLCLCAVAILSGCCGNGKGARYSRHIIIAPSNALKCDKRIADFVCDGVGDEQEINKAIERLPLGGTIQLLDGDYYLDSFDNEGNSAIYFGYNNGNARTITITGTTENKAYNTRHGAVINVSDKAWAAMDPDTTYRVAYGAAQKPEGDFFKYTHVNNVNFENLFIMFPDAQRKAIGLDCRLTSWSRSASGTSSASSSAAIRRVPCTAPSSSTTTRPDGSISTTASSISNPRYIPRASLVSTACLAAMTRWPAWDSTPLTWEVFTWESTATG